MKIFNLEEIVLYLIPNKGYISIEKFLINLSENPLFHTPPMREIFNFIYKLSKKKIINYENFLLSLTEKGLEKKKSLKDLKSVRFDKSSQNKAFDKFEKVVLFTLFENPSKKGLSSIAIINFINANNQVFTEPTCFEKQVRNCIKKCINKGFVEKIEGTFSFKLTKETKVFISKNVEKMSRRYTFGTQKIKNEIKNETNLETKPEKTKPEKTKPEKTKPEKTKPEKTKPEKTKPEKTKPENILENKEEVLISENETNLDSIFISEKNIQEIDPQDNVSKIELDNEFANNQTDLESEIE